MSESTEGGEKPKGERARIGELGPAWITAIAALITAVAGTGLFVFLHSGNGQQPAIASSAVPSSSATPALTPPDGTQLGSYSVKLSLNYSVTLGPAAPVQSQIVAGTGGDISETGGGLIPAIGDQMHVLPMGTIPTYEQCAANTSAGSGASTIPGTAFCLVEQGRIAGVTVTSRSSALPPSYVVLKVTIWQNAS